LLGHRAVLNARSASGAAILSDIAGALADFHLEIARFAVYGFQVCIRYQFDI
jgi:hypothetical protein